MPNREVAGDTDSSLSIEGFGIVFLEAAACGKPVIAGRSGGAQYAVEHGYNGMSVGGMSVGGLGVGRSDDECDPLEELKQAIRELSDPEKRTEMGRAGLEFASRFDWQKSADLLRSYL